MKPLALPALHIRHTIGAHWDAAQTRLRGPRCPLCGDRVRPENMREHDWNEHAGDEL